MSRNYTLDFMKIMSIGIIIMHHYTAAIYVNSTGFFFGGPVYFGRLVELLYIISGYLMYKYQKKIITGCDFVKFYMKRVYRLLPLVALAATLYEVECVVFNGAVDNLKLSNLNLSEMLFDSLGVQCGWASMHSYVNSPTWYISVLLLCYLIFYVLNRVASKMKFNVNYLYIMMILLGVSILSYEFNFPFFNRDSGRGYYSFFTGILLANIIKNYNFKISKYSFWGIIILALTIFEIVYCIRRPN